MDAKSFFKNVVVGKKYLSLDSIDDQIKYVSMVVIFLVAIFPLLFLGVSMYDENRVVTMIDLGLAVLCVVVVALVRIGLPFKKLPFVPIALYGAYSLYLLWQGTRGGWPGAWAMSFPIISIFICGFVFGVVSSAILGVGLWVLLLSPFQLGFFNIGGSYMSAAYRVRDPILSSRFIAVYLLIFAISVIYDRIIALKNRKEKALSNDLLYEKDTIQKMKDNMNLGVFLMSNELVIQPQYSKQLATVLSKYDEKLDGKNFVDILGASLDARQRKIIVNYFSMIFAKSKSLQVLEEANPFLDFEYKIDGRTKFLTAKFQLVEREGEASYILCVVEDVTRQKELSREIELRKKEQETEMKDLFDIVQVNPLVFEDFISTVEDNFKDINAVLKDSSLSEREVLTRFFQDVHSMKSNATILGLESFAKKLHDFESRIKLALNKSEATQEDVFALTVELETIMKEKDDYQKTAEKLSQFKAKHDVDGVLRAQLEKACASTASELNKRVEIKIDELDAETLESDLRKPIKEILLQFIRNSIYHGIELRGTIKVSVTRDGDRIVVDYSDDGKGIDYAKVEEKYKKLYPGSEPNKSQLLAALFKPEFSTASVVSSVAGRGVGLSLVKELIDKYKGKLSIGTKGGLTFKVVFSAAYLS